MVYSLIPTSAIVILGAVYSFGFIVTLHFKVFPSFRCAIIVVVPCFFPVIFPLLFTEAIDGLLDDHFEAKPLFILGSKINVGVTNYIWYSLFQHFCYDKRKTPKRHRLPNKRTWRYIKDV